MLKMVFKIVFKIVFKNINAAYNKMAFPKND